MFYMYVCMHAFMLLYMHYEWNGAVIYLLIYVHVFSIILYSNFFCWMKILIPTEPLYSVKSSLWIVTKYTQMTPSSFWVPRNLSHHMIKQARTGDTVLVKRREMTVRTQNPAAPWRLGGGWVKTTENKKLAPVDHLLVFPSPCLYLRHRGKKE